MTKEEVVDWPVRYVSTCCGSAFTYPGWPDSDICQECGKRSDAIDEQDWAAGADREGLK